jgi:uncharacterized protein (TIGR02597 family)
MGIRFLAGAQEVLAFFCFSLRGDLGPMVGRDCKKIKNPLTATSVVLIFLRMKLLRSSLATLIAAGLSANAQPTTATTDPVGFVSYKVNANSDQKLGLPMQQASTFQGTAATVSSTTVTSTGLTSLSGANFLLVTSGLASGKWEQVVTSATGSLTIAQAIPGFAASDSFEIKPFWTLSAMFPDGGAITKSTDLFDPVAEILMNNPSAQGVNIPPSSAYFYFVGDADYPAGWYDSSNPDGGLQNNMLISPDSLFTIRNKTSAPFTISMVGSVPTDAMALDVNTRVAGPQDNPVYNMFPSDVTLANSGLAPNAITPSSDVFDPGDQLLVYPLNNSGFNTAAPIAYFYFGGDADYAAGWYDSSDPDGGLRNEAVLSAGSGVIIRKAAGKTATTWNPTVPYSLQ